MSILILGAGFAGIGMAIRLKQAGIEDFLVLEKASEVGGTWRDNRYPGCACDVESHLYSFSFEPNPGWSRMFAPREEILQYIRHCVKKYRIEDHIRCGREAVRARFDEAAACWRVDTLTGERFEARLLICGLGLLHTPAFPALPGMQAFAGEAFHSAHWDPQCDLRNKRVAVIGTGASAIQFVPAIASRSGHVDVYQRSAPWILPKPDRPMAAWEKRLFRTLPATQRALRESLYWRNEARVVPLVTTPRLLRVATYLAKKNLHREVADPVLRAKLTPRYTIGCKRVLLTNDWYAALQRDDVSLVTDPIARVVETGIQTADGGERRADVIIYGTGFAAQSPVPPGAILGRGARDLGIEWRRRPEAYKGAAVAGYPNLFFLGGPNTSLGHNSILVMHEAQIDYIMGAVEQLRTHGRRILEVRQEAQDDFNEWLRERSRSSVWQEGGCQSWYINADGYNTALWPDFTFRFREATRHFDVESYLTD